MHKTLEEIKVMNTRKKEWSDLLEQQKAQHCWYFLSGDSSDASKGALKNLYQQTESLQQGE